MTEDQKRIAELEALVLVLAHKLLLAADALCQAAEKRVRERDGVR